MQEVLVDILVATYNGERFLEKQLDSLLQQTHQNIKIYIRDDGSTDRTITIIKKYQQKDDRIYVIEDDKGNLGVVQNFNELATHSTANYCCFCDQDDIWLPNKIAISLSTLQQLEQQHTNKACMVYSDLKIIDERDSVLHESVWKSHNIFPKYFILNRVLVYNIPFGCTIMCNSIFLRTAIPFPTATILHDHWFALIACTFGCFTNISDKLVLLRNHDNNFSRKKVNFFENFFKRINNLRERSEFNYQLDIRTNQAASFLERYKAYLSDEQIRIINSFILLKFQKGIERKLNLVKNKFFSVKKINTIKMILRY